MARDTNEPTKPNTDRDFRRPTIAIVPGDVLEYRVMRLFAWQGYFVRRGVDIYTEGFQSQATDIDVLAVKLTSPFRKHLQIVECKSGKVGPLDRIFWLSGVKQYVGAEHATLVREDTKQDIKAFARRNGIEFLDLKTLVALEHRLGVLHDASPALIDREYISSRRTDWQAAIRSDLETSLYYAFISGETRWDKAVASIRYIIFNMRRFTKHVMENPEADVWRMLLVTSMSHICMFFASLAGETLGFRIRDVSEIIHRELKYGTIDPKIAQHTMRLAQRISEQAVAAVNVDPSRLDRAQFDFPQPSLVSEITAIYELVVESGGVSENLPPFVDYVFGETYLRRHRNMPWLSAPSVNWNVERLGRLTFELCEALKKIEALPHDFDQGIRKIFPSLMTDKHTPPAPSTIQKGEGGATGPLFSPPERV